MNRLVAPPSELAVAVDVCLETRSKVYAVDPDQILRDARGAREATRDHISRVVYELLQNAEDAGSDCFVIHIQSDPPIAYFCDNGQGVASAAVKSLAGLFLSPKTSGIGRKGIGFKAAFSICAEPIVMSGEDGVVFDKNRARSWMQTKGLPISEVPFQWLPFWTSRAELTRDLNIPPELQPFRTIVALKLSNTEALKQISRDCSEFDASSLLTFEYVRTFRVENPTHKSFCIAVEYESDSGSNLVLQDSRDRSKGSWRLHRARLDVPVDVLDTFEAEERERYRIANIVLGVECESDGAIRRARKARNLLVYYPTRHRTPNRFLCHADFLVSSDRARIADPSSNRYNGWLGGQVAREFVSFANTLSEERGDRTSSILAALRSVDDDDAIIGVIRKLIVQQASTQLVVPSIAGRSLTPKECLLLGCADATKALDVARQLSLASRLACEEVLGDQEAISALVQFGATVLTDVDLLHTLNEDITTGRVSTEDLGLGVWRWSMATKVLHKGSAQHGESYADLLAQVPILPGQSQSYSPQQTKEVPFALCNAPAGNYEAVQVSFCHDEIVRQLREAPDSDEIVAFLKALGAETDATIALIRALDISLDRWEDASPDDRGHASTFLKLIAAWKLTSAVRPSQSLGNTPVPVRSGDGSVEWIRAFKAYRVTGTNARLMSLLIGGDKAVPTVKMSAVRATGADEHVLDWLGCPTRPQVVSWTGAESANAELRRTYSKIHEHGLGCTGVVRVGPLKSLSAINISTLSEVQFSALLGLLASGWAEYYKQHSRKYVTYTYYTEKYLELDEQWWEDVQDRMVPTSMPGKFIEFKRCLVVLPAHARAFGPFVPTLQLPGVPDLTRRLIRQWMETTLGRVLSPEKMNWHQWKELLEEFIPEVLRNSEKPEPLSRRVRETYRAFFAWCRQSPVLGSVNVIVAKRAHGKYDLVDPTECPVYLNDEPYLAKQCPEAVLLFECHEAHRALAVRVMNLRRLSETISDRQCNELPSESPAFKNVHQRFRAGRPYLLALLQNKHHDSDIELHMARLERIAVIEVDQLEYTAQVETTDESATVNFSRSAECVDDTVYVLSREGDSRDPVVVHAAREIAMLLHLLDYERLIEAILASEDAKTLHAFLTDAGVSEELIRDTLDAYNEPDVVQPGSDVEGEPEGDKSIPNRQGSGTQTERKASPRKEEKKAVEEPPKAEPEAAVKCKDGRTANYVLRETVPQAGRGRSPEPRLKGEVPSTPRAEPSPPNRQRIEESSRAFCLRHLQKLGFDAVEMGYSSKGFDIKATRNGRELRVEVKGHLRQSNNVILTGPEWEMYAQSKLPDSDYDWELWNVENLDTEAGEALISRYVSIPDDAIAADRFEISLTQCSLHED